MKNLIMGTGKGYDWHTFEPFVNSFLKNSAENTDLVLFVDGISKITENKLNGGGAHKA